jgi:hypothetical protein
LNFIYIVLIYRHYEQKSINKVTYKVPYFDGGFMIHRLQFGDILQVKSGKKAGRWYCKAKIPVEYRDAYKDSQATAWLGSGSLADAQTLLPKVKEKEQQKFLSL